MSGTLHLRPYQEDALVAVLGAHHRGVRSALLVMPTGSGKTIVFVHAILNLLRPGQRALVLAHRDELIGQAVGKLRDVLGDALPIGIVKAERDETDARIIVASVQTLSRPASAVRSLSDVASWGCPSWRPASSPGPASNATASQPHARDVTP